MGFTQPDSAPTPPGQMPAAGSGPAPVPGPSNATAWYDVQAPLPDVSPGSTPGASVLAGTTGANHVSESPLAAPNLNPYEAGSPDPISAMGAADAGGRDIVAGSVAGAVANAEARFGELQGDVYGQGSTIGDVWALPPGFLDPGVGSLGETEPTAAYYDPPRNYGG